MLKYYILIIFSLFYIQYISGQNLLESYTHSFPAEDTGLCRARTSIALSYTDWFYKTEFGIVNTNFTNLIIETSTQNSLSFQVIVFEYLVTEGEHPIEIILYNLSKPVDTKLHPSEPVVCQNVRQENFKITNTPVGLFIPRGFLGLVYLNLNFTENNSILPEVSCICAIDVPYRCTFSIISKYLPNYYQVTISQNSLYSSTPPSNLTITLTLRNYLSIQPLTFVVNNPFPLRERTTDIIQIDNYPSFNYMFVQDYRLRFDYFSAVTIATIRDMNSLIMDNIFGIYFTTYVLVESSGNLQKYMSLSPMNATTYLLDSDATKVGEIAVSSSILTIPDTPYMEIVTDGSLSKSFLRITSDMTYQNAYYQISLSMGNIKYTIDIPRSKIYDNDKHTFEVFLPYNTDYIGDITALIYPINNPYDLSIPSDGKVSTFSLNSIEFQQVLLKTFIIKINVTTLYPLLSMDFSNVIINGSNRISGDEYNGYYEIMASVNKLDDKIQLIIYDSRGQSKYYYQGQAYNDKFDIFPSIPYTPNDHIAVKQLSYFKFEKLSIDLSNGPVNNLLYLNYTVYNPNFIPYFTIDSTVDSMVPGIYDTDSHLYVFNFTVQPYLLSGDIYTIGDYNDMIEGFDYKFIKSVFGDVASRLDITNQRGDILKPILQQLYSFQTSTSIGWSLVISDGLNGFLYGSIQVISELDIEPYYVTINSSHRVSGDEFLGTYNFTIDMPSTNCRNQTYILDRLNLFDLHPSIATFDSINPIRGSIYEPNLNIVRNCTGTPDNEKPFLHEITYAPTLIRVGGFDRSVMINFTTSDRVSGISERYNPIVYFTTDNMNVFSIKSTLVSNNGTHFSYSTTGQLPHAFGANSLIFFSIYGIYDNQLNYRSYTSMDLNELGQPYYANGVYNANIPFIDSTTKITKYGGNLLINGKSLGTSNSTVKAMINYQDGNGYQEIDIILNSSIALQISPVGEFKNEYLTVKVEVNGIQSNELKVYPITTAQDATNPTPSPSTTPTPTTTNSTTPTPSTTSKPSTCPGTPVCNNRGTCESYGCECQSPWYGPSCSSNINPINPPIPQPDPSIYFNFTENGKVLNVKIQVIEIREMDPLDNIVNRFELQVWNFTVDNKTLDPTYLYNTQLKDRETNVGVKIVFYQNETQVKFGNETLKVHSSSIKYAIDLSSFKFDTKINYLQVVMEASISSTDDSCSAKQIGRDITDNVNWIKMNIDKSSLYGRFINFGIIDQRSQTIMNKIIEDDEEIQPDSTTYRSIRVGITIPHYEDSVYLDPDFSILVDIDDTTVDFMCKSKKKLSSGAIAGIVVGCVVFVSLAIGATLYLKKRRTTKLEQKRIANKLKKLQE